MKNNSLQNEQGFIVRVNHVCSSKCTLNRSCLDANDNPEQEAERKHKR